jgi:adenylyltransferase/sulfurtransferase
VPNCSEIGVIGILPGLAGTVQANEAIKIICEIGEPLSGRLLILDALTMNSTIIKISSNPDNYKIKELGVYDFSCETAPASFEPGFKEIDVEELKHKIDSKEDIFLLDVREPHEFEICRLSDNLIPMNTIPQNIEKIPTDIPVVVYCHHGMRSAMVVKFLSEEFGLNNLFNLEGGIHAWAHYIDKGMPKY